MKQLTQGKETYWQCEECRFIYDRQEAAKECEAWCLEHQSCNAELIRHAVFGENDWYDPEWGEEYEEE